MGVHANRCSQRNRELLKNRSVGDSNCGLGGDIRRTYCDHDCGVMKKMQLSCLCLNLAPTSSMMSGRNFFGGVVGQFAGIGSEMNLELRVQSNLDIRYIYSITETAITETGL